MDWTGDKHSVFCTLGASNHSKEERVDNDFYATSNEAVEMLMKHERFQTDIWECACGVGHISDVMKKHGYYVYSSDIVDRGYGDEFYDFLEWDNLWHGDIITNPPYKKSLEFVSKALEIVEDGAKVAMLLRLQFLEGQKRYDKLLKHNPPMRVYVPPKRLVCARGADFESNNTGAMCLCWFVWQKGYKGDTTIKWMT